jgi:nicotinamidase-related amidase
MQTLIVVDAQNEFSAGGRRAVPNHEDALEVIRLRVARARREGRPIAWVRHHNWSREWPAFKPGSQGADYSPGMGPLADRDLEAEFVKQVFGAFTGSAIGVWLDSLGCDDVMILGFYAHMCVSTTAREALMRGLRVAIDPSGVGSCAIQHPTLGQLSADEARRTALLHLSHLGVRITPRTGGR